jgi:hypothetical protein
MSIDAGDRWVEYEIKERERVGRYMYDHQEDYVSRSRYEKTVDQLDKAKKLIKDLLGSENTSCEEDMYFEIRQKAENFLKENEVEK